MSEYLSLSVGKDQRQFVREPFPVMQNSGSVFFLFFPMVGELDRTPVGDVPIFSFAEYPVEHSRGTEQADMPAMKRRERPPFDISQLGEQYTAGLSVGRRFQQQVLYLVQRNSRVGQYNSFGGRNLVTNINSISQRL